VIDKAHFHCRKLLKILTLAISLLITGSYVNAAAPTPMPQPRPGEGRSGNDISNMYFSLMYGITQGIGIEASFINGGFYTKFQASTVQMNNVTLGWTEYDIKSNTFDIQLGYFLPVYSEDYLIDGFTFGGGPAIGFWNSLEYGTGNTYSSYFYGIVASVGNTLIVENIEVGLDVGLSLIVVNLQDYGYNNAVRLVPVASMTLGYAL